VWGIDSSTGRFISRTDSFSSAPVLRNLFRSSPNHNLDIERIVTEEVKGVRNTLVKEVNEIKQSSLGEKEIGQRLIYLFQRDLLPGVNGQILEAKHNRDNLQNGVVSYSAKVCCWIFILVLNGGMLFYILLFALQQSPERQDAWFQSFLIWITIEICFVSTMIVYITHILIPSFIKNDILKIKEKILQSMRQLQNENYESKSGDVFNAARFLYASTRLAEMYPTIRESKIILKFSTPWPLHSYIPSVSITKHYSKKYTFITNSLKMVLIYVLKGFIYIPPSIQDFICQLVSTSGIGYAGVLLIKLYRIHPALPLLPVIIIAVIIHLVIRSNQEKDRFGKLKDIVPLSTNALKDTVSGQQVMSNNINNNNNNAPSHVTRRQSVMAALTISEQLMNSHNRSLNVASNENDRMFDLSSDSDEMKMDVYGDTSMVGGYGRGRDPVKCYDRYMAEYGDIISDEMSDANSRYDSSSSSGSSSNSFRIVESDSNSSISIINFSSSSSDVTGLALILNGGGGSESSTVTSSSERHMDIDSSSEDGSTDDASSELEE
jgi:hypothetical protein